MGAMVVEVGPEIEQLVFEIRCSPEQNVIQILASKGADQPFHEWMGQGNVGDRLDFPHLQYPQIGLSLVKPVERIIVGAEVLRQPVLPSNGAIEHPTECGTIDRSRMDTESNDPARELIHDHQDPVRPQGGRSATQQIDTPEAVRLRERNERHVVVEIAIWSHSQARSIDFHCLVAHIQANQIEAPDYEKELHRAVEVGCAGLWVSAFGGGVSLDLRFEFRWMTEKPS